LVGDADSTVGEASAASADAEIAFDPDAGALARLIVWSHEDQLTTIRRTLPEV
jgi:hypothetical protein